MLKKLDITEKLVDLPGRLDRKKPKRKDRPTLDEFHERMAHSLEGLMLSEEDGVTPRFKDMEKDKLEQVCSLDCEKPTELKWTVVKDPFAEEFTMLTKEMEQIKSSPPVYASTFENARIAASHVGLYTVILGSYDMRLEELSRKFLEISEKKKIFQVEK